MRFSLFFIIMGHGLFYFFMGSFVFKFQESLRTSRIFVAYLMLASLILLVNLIVLKSLPQLLNFLSIKYFVDRVSTISRMHLNLSIANFFFLLILSAAFLDRIKLTKRFNSFYMFVGSLTYSTYLWHLPIQVAILLFFDLSGWSRSIFDSKIIFLIYIFSMIVIGRFSYLHIERPLQNFIRKKYLA
jgi:peptidoglycan/LPS O-acetylase OafA/YrhL